MPGRIGRPYIPPRLPNVSPSGAPAQPTPAPSMEAETRVVPDLDARQRNRIRHAFPALSDADVPLITKAYFNVAGRAGFTKEMQDKPFEERFLGGLQASLARPLRQVAGPSIQRWNELVAQLAPKYPELADLQLKYGKRVPGISIYELIERVDRDNPVAEAARRPGPMPT